MLKSFSFALLLAFTSVALNASGDKGKSVPFKVSIATPTTVVKSGQTVPIHIVLSSTSKQELVLGEVVNTNQGELNYIVKIHTDKGAVPPLTVYGSKVTAHRIFIVSTQVRTLHDGDVIEDDLSIDQMYDISKPAKYFVQVLRSDGSVPERLVSSNELEITVR